MTYNELLLKNSWYEKCVEILHRDQYRCQKCGKLGYHNNAYFECQTANELDNFLNGILIEGKKPSVYIDEAKTRTKLHNFIIHQNENDGTANSQSIGGSILYDLSISRGILGFSPFILPTASKSKIQDKKCKGSFLPIDKNDVIIPKEIDFQYSTGNYFILDEAYFDNYIVRMEKRWPTGACADSNYGSDVIMWGSIIVSICYHECCISLEFLDKSIIDNEGNYLETPVLPKALNVHHKYYVAGKNPWEYSNDALITLCQDCHCDEHKSTLTPIYKNLYDKHVMAYAQICDRCGGSGYLPQYQHVQGGVCFKCQGEGVIVDPHNVIAGI